MEDNSHRRSIQRRSIVCSISLVLFLLFALTGLSAGASVSFDQSVVCASPGTETPVSLILDSAPAGISGYSIIISIEDPNIGEITAVTLPEWAEISDITGVPGPDVQISAVDLQGKVEKGATGIMLATLSLKAISRGTTDIILHDPQFDDAVEGTPMNPSLVNATFTVSDDCTTVITETPSQESTVTMTTGITVPPTGTGGGGSGGGSSSGSAPAVTTVIGTSGPETSPTGEQTSEQTAGTTPAMTSPSMPSAPTGETTPPSPTGQGIPFLSVPGMLVLIGVIILLGLKKR